MRDVSVSKKVSDYQKLSLTLDQPKDVFIHHLSILKEWNVCFCLWMTTYDVYDRLNEMKLKVFLLIQSRCEYNIHKVDFRPVATSKCFAITTSGCVHCENSRQGRAIKVYDWPNRKLASTRDKIRFLIV